MTAKIYQHSQDDYDTREHVKTVEDWRTGRQGLLSHLTYLVDDVNMYDDLNMSEEFMDEVVEEAAQALTEELDDMGYPEHVSDSVTELLDRRSYRQASRLLDEATYESRSVVDRLEEAWRNV